MNNSPASESTLSERVRWARERLGMSARAVSEAADIAPALVGMIERDAVKNPRGETVAALARALGVNAGWLLTGDGPALPTDITTAAR